VNNRILIPVVALLSAGAGAWITQYRMTSAQGTSAPASEPEHRHELVETRDAQGKTYYTCSMHPQVRSEKPGQCPICGMPLVKKLGAAAATPASAERKPLYWYDPMKPDQHFDKPGKSPFMDMALVPMYADDTGDESAGMVSIDPRMAQNLGIRTAAVERSSVTQELHAAGSITIDENRIEVVQTRTAGWVEKLHVRAVGDAVRKGQLLAEIYAPELYAAQQEYLLAVRAQDTTLTAAARQRLLLLGLGTDQIARLEKSGVAQRRVAYSAPVDGVVTELGVRDGAQLTPGMSLYTLADLSKVWITAEVPEAQAASLAKGFVVAATLAALPDRTFGGRVDYVYPEVNAQTRTVRVRAVFDNPQLLLKPGMFAEVTLGKGQMHEALLVPSEALIRTGTRTTVIVAGGEGRFRAVEVRVGAQHEGQTEVLEGLHDGQNVVASGQFLIDSEANLRGAFGKFDTTSQPASTEPKP
jgi:Cu(I)/Ag(I) efflux system membrane fusion protein